MNNSPIVGIIICGPQGCGKTTFVNNLLKDNKFGRTIIHKDLINLYDLDALVFDGLSRRELHQLKKLPNVAKIRLPFTTEDRWLQRPLIIVETNTPIEELGNQPEFEIIHIHKADHSASMDLQYTQAAEKIFQFILSKTK